MKNVNEQITFEQAQNIIADGGVPDVSHFSFSLDYIQKDVRINRGACGVSRTRHEREIHSEETLIHYALSVQNFNAAIALINIVSQDIPRIVRERTRVRTFKEHVPAYEVLILDTDCNEWGEWTEWTEKNESVWVYAESMDAPISILDRIKKRLQSLSSEELLIEGLNKAVIDPYKDKVVRAKQNKDGRQVSLYGFPDKAQASVFEYKWQQQVTHRFFRVGMPLSQNKRSFQIYTTIQNHINANPTKPIPVDNLPRRSFIIALTKIMSESGHMPELTFKIGITKIKLTRESSFATRQQGNFSMKLIPELEFDLAYGKGLEARLKNFTQPKWDRSEKTYDERQKQFLQLIEKNLTQLTPFTADDLNKYQNIRINSDKEAAEPSDERTKYNLHLLNALLFLITTVEVLVRLYRTEDGGLYTYPDLNDNQRTRAQCSDNFPVAIAQSRSFSLLLEGEISFADFWGASMRNGLDNDQHRAYYGAVTGRNTIDYINIMMEKLSAINELYNNMVSNLSGWKAFNDTFNQSNKKGTIIEGRSRMYFDLKSGYGSGNESDPDTNYSDTEDSDLHDVTAFHI